MSLSLVNKFLFFRAIEIECRCFFFRQRAQYWDQDSNMANVFQVLIFCRLTSPAFTRIKISEYDL